LNLCGEGFLLTQGNLNSSSSFHFVNNLLRFHFGAFLHRQKGNYMNTTAKKYGAFAHMIGTALTQVDPTKDPALWTSLKALQNLAHELEVNTAQLEARLAQLEASAPQKG
jgi:hypothetical protein